MEFTSREPSLRLPAIENRPAPPKPTTSSEIEHEETTPLILDKGRRSSNTVFPEPDSPRLQAWGTEIKTEKAATSLEAVAEDVPEESTEEYLRPRIEWSTGWFFFLAGFVLYFPFIVGTLLPVVSAKHRTFNNKMAGIMSLVTFFYLTMVAATVVTYRLTCDPSTCGMHSMSWINDLFSTS